MNVFDCMDLNHRVVTIFRVPHLMKYNEAMSLMVATHGYHCRTCKRYYRFGSPVFVDVTLWPECR